MNNRLFVLLTLFMVAVSCSKKKPANDYNKGSITIIADDSFKSVTEALADAYMMNYPDTKIDVKIQKEDLALLDLLKDKAKLIVMSRDLSPKEKAEFKRVVELDYRQDKFAADGVLFVVPKNSPKTSISMDEIQKELLSDNRNLIFDGTNSSNLNFIAQKFKRRPEELKYSIISGNQNVIEQMSLFPNKVGVVSLNTLSRPYSKDATALRDKVKILPIEYKGKLIYPEAEELRNMTYPFTRILYFLTNEGTFGLANGIIRFSCTQKGQFVVEKEGLQPYNLFKREVQMNDK